MRIRRGEVALAYFPFSSGVGSKKRPVRIIQNDRDNLRRVNMIVAQITSNLRRVGDPTHFFIEVESDEGRSSGLLQDSLVVSGNLATIEQNLIERIIGQLSSEAMASVDECLKLALGL